jgi:hypothetical protein
MPMLKKIASGLILLLLLGVAAILTESIGGTTSKGANTTSSDVTVVNRTILVDGLPYILKGVGYAPTPIGVDPEVTPPYGDYFTSDYSSIYLRDFPLLRQMGANTIRLWGWNNQANHTDFLNKAYNNGVNPIRVIVTFWMDPSYYPDISSTTARTQIISAFRNMVALNKDNPAVLMWSIGNEANAPWQYGSHLDDLFSLINEMALAAHTEEGANAHPVTTPLADADLLNTINNYDKAMTNLDVWSIQVYRGNSFGSLFSDYASLSSKPLAITEYGIDAYDNNNHAEYEKIGSPYPAIYAQSLWSEIASNSNVCVGGSIMTYSDEWWKGKYGSPTDNNASYHGESGYAAYGHPDGFSNEEWWGIMRTVDNGSAPDVMEPRAAYYALQTLWVTNSPTPSPTPTATPTPTPTPTTTPTPSPTPTTIPSPTPTVTPAPSPTSLPSPSPTPTTNSNKTATPTPTPTPTLTTTPTANPTSNPTSNPTANPTITTQPTSTPNTNPSPTPIPEIPTIVFIVPVAILMVALTLLSKKRKTPKFLSNFHLPGAPIP